MLILNINDYQIPLRILGLLIILGIPIVILLEIILMKLRRIERVKMIFGFGLIIFGSSILIIGIWEDIGWNYYLKNCNPCIMANYTAVFALCIILSIVLVNIGIYLIHKSKISK